MSDIINELKWKKFSVLNDGHVCLVDVMGDDSSIVQAARVSYGEGTKTPSDDRTLIRYLMRHRHTTPFEMAELKFRVRVPMDCWRQWIRHRTANVNEYSTRYSEAIDSQQRTEPDGWRLQSGNNKQGSEFGNLEWPDGNVIPGYQHPGEYLTARENGLLQRSEEVYQERLKSGVAREQARKDLPLSTYTEAYWKIDLHNLLHFLSLRMDSHAQKEIRDYATIIGDEIVSKLFPMTWEAFTDYRLNGMFLTGLDIKTIQEMMKSAYCRDEGVVEEEQLKHFTNKRERKECITKLQKMGIIQ